MGKISRQSLLSRGKYLHTIERSTKLIPKHCLDLRNPIFIRNENPIQTRLLPIYNNSHKLLLEHLNRKVNRESGEISL